MHGWVSELAWKQLRWDGMAAALVVVSAWESFQGYSFDYTISEAQLVILMCYFPLFKSTCPYPSNSSTDDLSILWLALTTQIFSKVLRRKWHTIASNGQTPRNDEHQGIQKLLLPAWYERITKVRLMVRRLKWVVMSERENLPLLWL